MNAVARIRERLALIDFVVFRLKHQRARLVTGNAFREHEVIFLSTAFAGQVDRLEVLEVFTTILAGRNQFQGVLARCARHRNADRRRGSADGLLGVAHLFVGGVEHRGFQRDIFVGHYRKANSALAFVQHVLRRHIMQVQVGTRIWHHHGLHLVAGNAALGLHVKGVCAFDRLNVTVFIAHACTYQRLVRRVHRFCQFERPVGRLAFFWFFNGDAEAVFSALGTAGKGTCLDRITWLQCLGLRDRTDVFPAIWIRALCGDVDIDDVIERSGGVIDRPDTQDKVVTTAVCRDRATVFVLALAIATGCAVDRHATAAFNLAERRQLKAVAGDRQVGVPATFGDEVLPACTFMGSGIEPAEVDGVILDFSQVPAVGRLGVQCREAGMATACDLAVGRAELREPLRGFANGLRFILSCTAVNVQPLLTCISPRWRGVHVTVSSCLLSRKQGSHQR